MPHPSITMDRNSLALSLALFAVTLSAIPASASAQPAGTITFPACEAPVEGTGPTRSNRDDWSGWSRQPTGPLGVACTNEAPSRRPAWSDILLADIDADGLDDLCGLWGPVNQTAVVNGSVRVVNSLAFVYGCVRNLGNGRFGGGFRQAHAFNGTRDASVHTTIRAVDFNGDGRLDLCGRAADGIRCQTSTTTSAGFATTYTLAQPSFSNGNGWDNARYYSTIDFVRLEGMLNVCGRGIAGVLCFPRTQSGFNNQAFLQTSFSDSNGWNLPEHYSTLRFVDVNGDGHSDVCGRGDAGIVCSLWRPSPWRAFDTARVWTTQFNNSAGWSSAKYYSSIRFGDINLVANMADVCGRGDGGLYCGLSNGASFLWAASSPLLPQMADGTGWDDQARLASLQIVDYDGDNKKDVCGLELQPGQAQPDLRCAKSNSTLTALAFAMPETRVDRVSVSQGRVVAGHLWTSSPRVGFCWVTAQDVNCGNQWR